MKTRKMSQYLLRYSTVQGRSLIAPSFEGIDQTVVIPALAEKKSLFNTLASLSRNPTDDLQRTLVICVVNNHRIPLSRAEQVLDNQETLRMIESLIFTDKECNLWSGRLVAEKERIARSSLRLAYIDASSAGCEIPDRDGGVGTARKIGMDAALGVLQEEGVICCLDADTLVEENYLSAIRDHFERTADPGAVTAYEHQQTPDQQLQAAICCYEIFLRSYVIGLFYAESPYAYHAIGSTMACTADGYRSVRGMNRRNAAEDFHFLDKLAKTGRIGTVEETKVFPAPRVSERVPFGTGQRMQRFTTGSTDEYRVHSPECFEVLREWLSLMQERSYEDIGALLNGAKGIHSSLEEYLRSCRFDRAWPRIQRNSRDAVHLRRQFHMWFDGLKTLRLIHYLGRSVFTQVPMFRGLEDLVGRMRMDATCFRVEDEKPDLDVQLGLLKKLRSLFPRS